MVETCVPVQWLLEQRELGLRVLAGKDELQRRITWPHSIELADPVPWLDGGELVLTTGLRLPGSAAGRRSYVESVNTAGVAGLAFGVACRSNGCRTPWWRRPIGSGCHCWRCRCPPRSSR